MEVEVGAILTGKVTGITKFGAFVTIGPGKSGLVHISEIANTYVNDVHDHLTEGQEVNVKVISIDDAGRINLSIKAAAPAPAAPARAPRTGSAPRQNNNNYQPRQPRPERSAAPRQPQQERVVQPPAEPSFEDKLKRFMQDSDSKISGLRQYADKKSSRRRR